MPFMINKSVSDPLGTVNKSWRHFLTKNLARHKQCAAKFSNDPVGIVNKSWRHCLTKNLARH